MVLCSEEKEKALKSMRAAEMEALKMRGLAKERRTWLRDCEFFFGIERVWLICCGVTLVT